MRLRFPIVTTAVLVAATACSSGGGLEAYELPGPRLIIDRPAGWEAVTEGNATLFAETREAFDAAYVAPRPPATALTIVFDHRPIDFLVTIGFPLRAEDEPAAFDVFEFNVSNFRWEVVGETGIVEVLGEDAVRARVITSIGVSDVVQGVLPGGDEVFLLELSGPDAAALDRFSATFDEIVASVAVLADPPG